MSDPNGVDGEDSEGNVAIVVAGDVVVGDVAVGDVVVSVAHGPRGVVRGSETPELRTAVHLPTSTLEVPSLEDRVDVHPCTI